MAENRPRPEDNRLYIPVAKLPELLKGPTISIFHKADANSRNTILCPRFPKEAATSFCSRIKSAISHSKDGFFTIVGGDEKAHNDVLQWILDCCSSPEGTKHHFRTVANSEHPFTYYPQVMESGEFLGIQGFASSLQKRMMAFARKNLMSIDEVNMYYDYYEELETRDEDRLRLREVAVESVFMAWWSIEKEARWNEKIDNDIEDLRYERSLFDKDLNDRMAAKKAERGEYLAKKRSEKEGVAAGGDAAGAGWAKQDENGHDGAGAAAGGWGWDQNGDGSGTQATGGWENAGTTDKSVSGHWDTDATTIMPGSVSWADEVQQEHDDKKW